MAEESYLYGLPMGGKLFYPKEKMLKNLTRISILYIIECTKFYVSYYILMENFNEVQEIPDVKETKEEPKTEESENSAKDAKKQQELNDKKEKEEKNNAELELTYQTALLDLKEVFSKIPEDLTDKSI